MQCKYYTRRFTSNNKLTHTMDFFSILKKKGKAVEGNSSIDPWATSSVESNEPEISIPEGKKRVHNLIILDESGSMQSIYRPALSGLNETLQTIREAQKEHEDQFHLVSLVAFDTAHYNKIYWKAPADKAVDIRPDQYRPSGGTPLYDAMGRAINELAAKVAKEDVVLVTIITDGYENASRQYSGKAIKCLVEAMKEKGWVFTYIGANQDVEAVAASMSIDNRLSFDADEESTRAMFEYEMSARKRFFGKVSENASWDDLSKGYFDR